MNHLFATSWRYKHYITIQQQIVQSQNEIDNIVSKYKRAPKIQKVIFLVSRKLANLESIIIL